MLTVVGNGHKARKHSTCRSWHLGVRSENKAPGSSLSHQITLSNTEGHRRLGGQAVLVIHGKETLVTFPHLSQVMLVYVTVRNLDIESVLAKVHLWTM